MPMEKMQSAAVVCRGGLDSNQNWLEFSAQNAGGAARLVNFEPSLFGGYRRINGYTYLEETDSGEVDPSNAEGKILGLAIFAGDDILCARKQTSGSTYNYYAYSPGSSWSAFTTGLTLSSTGLDKIRHSNFNFGGNDKIIFVDKVNNATVYDGTNWTNIDPLATGADFANAGGAQALGAPSLAKMWENHVFVSGDPTNPNVVAHSAPYAEYDWTSASGAGQIDAGFEVKQIYPFRDKLFVFGDDRIKYIYVNGTDFAIKDVTSDIGIYAPDSVVEVNGDLLFLSPDGIRPISATERNEDFEISSVSKRIQEDLRQLADTIQETELHSVVLRSKSQFRYFFSDESVADEDAEGIVGGLKNYGQGLSWEFGLLRGIRCSCAASGYFGSQKTEYVVHGGHDGKVYRQEQGSSFNGADILAQYHTPYLDFGEPALRKTLKSIGLFTRPEGSVNIDLSINYDWGILDRINPTGYELQSTGDIVTYGYAVYGTDSYGGISAPTMYTNIQGSGKSAQLRFQTNGTEPSYTIQSLLFVFEVNGFK